MGSLTTSLHFPNLWQPHSCLSLSHGIWKYGKLHLMGRMHWKPFSLLLQRYQQDIWVVIFHSPCITGHSIFQSSGFLLIFFRSCLRCMLSAAIGPKPDRLPPSMTRGTNFIIIIIILALSLWHVEVCVRDSDGQAFNLEQNSPSTYLLCHFSFQFHLYLP